MNNCPLIQVSHRLGHADASITLKVYSHFLEELTVDFDEYLPKIHAWYLVYWLDIPHESLTGKMRRFLTSNEIPTNPFTIGVSDKGGMAESGLL